MVWTARQATEALKGGGWALVRVPQTGQRERERWRITSTVHGEDYAVMRLDEAERFWRECFRGLMEANAEACIIGDLHAQDAPGLRAVIEQWLAGALGCMPAALAQAVHERRQPVVIPTDWRRQMAQAGHVPARGHHDVRALVGKELVRREEARLQRDLPGASLARVARRL
jgi:hypothetical protein